MIIDIAKELIISNFSFLNEDGYVCSFEIRDDETFIGLLNVFYTNSSKQRRITISYSKCRVYDEVKYGFSISIVKMGSTFDFSTDFFALNIYLDALGLYHSANSVNKFDVLEANMILQKLSSDLKMHASEIISGEDWKEGYYPK